MCVVTLLEFLPKLYLLIIASMILDVNGQGCTENWFGENCTFKCHCNSTKTCGVNGECPNNGSCETGFFGPGCQYVDLLIFYPSESVERYLIDYDDTTCNTQPDAPFVELSLNTEYPFTWFRIHVKEKENILNFTVELNSEKTCTSGRMFRVSDTVVDFTCDDDISVKNLRIVGPITPSICTVYISGGRNVALKEPTSQDPSPLDLNLTDTQQSSNAVDGDTKGTLDDSYCVNVDTHKTAVWKITYRRPQILYSVRIYNGDTFTQRLVGFIIVTGDENDKIVSYFQDSSEQPLDVYNVTLSSRDPVSTLFIKTNSTSIPEDQGLTLCEVETYGDTVCPDYTYGLSCSEKCSCNKSEACNAITGVCAIGCQPGFYGKKCSYNCNQNCLFQNCEFLSGNCFGCVPGYLGLQCSEECNPGTFGPDCAYSCPNGCRRNCNHTHGQCICKTSFTGSLCTECIAGLYGDNCTDTCPTFCVKQICNKQTGECLSCYGNHGGPLCEDCIAGSYGKLCTEKCPKYCTGNVCNRTTGECKTCYVNHKGRLCEDCTIPFYGMDCDKLCSVHCVDQKCDKLTGQCDVCDIGYYGKRCDRALTPSSVILVPIVAVLIYLYTCCRKKRVVAERELIRTKIKIKPEPEKMSTFVDVMEQLKVAASTEDSNIY